MVWCRCWLELSCQPARKTGKLARNVMKVRQSVYTQCNTKTFLGFLSSAQCIFTNSQSNVVTSCLFKLGLCFCWQIEGGENAIVHMPGQSWATHWDDHLANKVFTFTFNFSLHRQPWQRLSDVTDVLPDGQSTTCLHCNNGCFIQGKKSSAAFMRKKQKQNKNDCFTLSISLSV